MKKTLLNLEGSQELSKNEQRTINGGIDRPCGGDGSFIFVDGAKVCCFDYFSGLYIC
ncbi:hypothetical protein [Aquimarina celericrescens]|uniref:Bacteriocin n=1 Tax=Aquimarina celericrescens TaxID=1964542 RepID=A0ABW5AS01_9FLAO|nr:hypothetical protein [Aquimarina celericrescens]